MELLPAIQSITD